MSASPATRTFVCFPHAGGVAADFRRWTPPAGWALRVAGYPGRERWFHEPLARTVEALAGFVRPQLPTGRLVLFGHSLGALVAFAVARQLEAEGSRLEALVVAGHGAPAPREESALHRLDDERLLAKLVELGGMDPRIVAEPELLALLMPRIRADLEAAETYAPDPNATVQCPVLVLGGRRDEGVPLHALEAWASRTTASVTIRVLEGDHFFVHADPAAVRGVVSDFLGA